MLGMFAAALLPLISATPGVKPLTARELAPYNKLDAAVRQLPSSKKVSDLGRRLASLAALSDVPPQLARARAAYVWTTSHIAYALTDRADASSTLLAGSGNCDAHATLYKALCDGMSVECTRVTGYLRFPYAPGPAFAEATKRLAAGQWLVAHAWNAVRIGGQWGLVDTTLGTANGAVDPDDYFLPDPVVMATDHVPDAPSESLVTPIPLDKLARIPLLRPSSWRMNYDAADLLAQQGTDESSLRINLKWEPGMRVAVQTGAGSIENAALVQPQVDATGTEIRVCAPKNGAVAWLGVERDNSWRPLAGYPVKGASEQHLPTLMTRFYDSGATLEAPFRQDLTAGQATEIRLRAPGASRVVAFQGPDLAGMFQRDGETWVLRTTPSSGPALQIMASYENRNRFQGLLAYKVR